LVRLLGLLTDMRYSCGSEHAVHRCCAGGAERKFRVCVFGAKLFYVRGVCNMEELRVRRRKGFRFRGRRLGQEPSRRADMRFMR